MQSGKKDGTSAHPARARNFCYFSNFFHGVRNAFKADELRHEIVVIAFPALLTLAADPLASLVDSAFIGQLGSTELAAVGVSIAVFNLISKLLNFPVLNLTTSLVAVQSVDTRNVSEIETSKVNMDSFSEGKNTFIIVEDVDTTFEEEDSFTSDREQSVDTKSICEIEMEKCNSASEEKGDFISVERMDTICKGKDSFIPVTGREEKSKGKKERLEKEIPCKNEQPRRNLPAVSTALIVGSALGFFELIILMVGYGPILNVMGIPVGSIMRVPAKQYLTLRAIGCPAVVVSLAVQGVFRGFKDTRTPLFATVTGNVLNMVLVPILMFTLGYGVRGSAIATVISQYFIALILLLKLCKEVSLLPPRLAELKFGQFLKNGGLLLARSAAVLLCMTLATSLAARLGAAPMAAHQICMQVWLATSLLSDAIALSGQAIIATALAKGDYKLAETAAFRILQIGFVFGIILALILGASLGTFSKLFTTDKRALAFVALATPFVATTQPINSLAFIFDGLFFGSSDFSYAALSMIIVTIVSSGVMFLAESKLRFIGIWVGLTVLMTMRMLTGVLRLSTATGPWKFLR